MYNGYPDDDDFGIETDKYSWCKRVLNGEVSPESLLQYFEKNYSNDEKAFISKLKELL